MRYKIAFQQSEEGYSTSVPGLPGRWSQGAIEQEALENIQDAIHEYLAARDKPTGGRHRSRSRGRLLIVPKIPGVNHQDAVRAL